MSILSKLQALLTAANTKTGESDTTLTDAMQTLVDGYGQGGDVQLPSGYTRLLYLESSGTQYIDTGLYTKATQKYYVKCRSSTGSINILGNNLTTGCGMFLQTTLPTGYFRFGTANYIQRGLVPSNNANDMLMSAKIDINGFYLQDYLPDSYLPIGTFDDNSVVEDSSIHNILFGRTTGENARQLSASKIYFFACDEGDTRIREMYPAMRNSDSELGMYDVINNEFYTNSGTGTFTAGTME